MAFDSVHRESLWLDLLRLRDSCKDYWFDTWSCIPGTERVLNISRLLNTYCCLLPDFKVFPGSCEISSCEEIYKNRKFSHKKVMSVYRLQFQAGFIEGVVWEPTSDVMEPLQESIAFSIKGNEVPAKCLCLPDKLPHECSLHGDKRKGTVTQHCSDTKKHINALCDVDQECRLNPEDYPMKLVFLNDVITSDSGRTSENKPDRGGVQLRACQLACRSAESGFVVLSVNTSHVLPCLTTLPASCASPHFKVFPGSCEISSCEEIYKNLSSKKRADTASRRRPSPPPPPFTDCRALHRHMPRASARRDAHLNSAALHSQPP
ncbi:hypothetical protein GWK47_025643 [Chionoecetes opilio]|uniref:Uncharacterized protein n=1 Tax=Chionoecetes opilio TaxID=41210 RepID=A0A8J8WLH7_CHIOP|nr:hypothetical protein GWK47_025643 [Chionoecetes opilio]